MRAFICLRKDPLYRSEAFEAGARALGFEVHGTPRGNLRAGDVLIIWNRYGNGEQWAAEADAAGATVIVAENGYLGRDWRGDHWYTLSRDQHNGAGYWLEGDGSRWESFDVEFAPWRDNGDEIVVLPTRSIGPPGIAEPRDWARHEAARLAELGVAVRVREHPGETKAVDLEQDLKDARAVLTWGSGAALKALMLGIPVFFGFDRWIGRDAAMRWQRKIEIEPRCRRHTFHKLAWCVWRASEIATGEPIARLLRSK